MHIYKLLCQHYYEVMYALLSLQDNTIYHEDKNFILQNPENKRGSVTVEDSEFLLFMATWNLKLKLFAKYLNVIIVLNASTTLSATNWDLILATCSTEVPAILDAF